MQIKITKNNPLNIPADLLLIPVYSHNSQVIISPVINSADKALAGWLKQNFKDQNFTGEEKQFVFLDTHQKISPKRVGIIGAGEKKNFNNEKLRRLAATAIIKARAVGVKKIVFNADEIFGQKSSLVIQAIVEGAELGLYQFLKYKNAKDREKAKKNEVQDLIISIKKANTSLEKAAAEGVKNAATVIFARNLVNEPAGVMKPSEIVKTAVTFIKSGVKVEIFDEKQIKTIGLSGLLAVAAGSEEKPYFVHLSYKPKDKIKTKVAVCGKGITFDAGGLAIKPSQYMESMKCDMAGAAVILGLFSKIAELNLNAEVHGLIATAENMPSGKAVRPGDIITSFNGKTIEVINPDAEGRLILADALSWTEKELKPDYIIDFATLTGAAIVALGQEVAAIMGNEQKLVEKFMHSSRLSGEMFWQLPLVEEYKEILESKVADIRNIGQVHWADTIMGGLFLRDFVEKTPWLHIDIAGPAWVEKQILPYAPYGASGFGVRTLIQFLKDL